MENEGNMSDEQDIVKVSIENKVCLLTLNRPRAGMAGALIESQKRESIMLESFSRAAYRGGG